MCIEMSKILLIYTIIPMCNLCFVSNIVITSYYLLSIIYRNQKILFNPTQNILEIKLNKYVIYNK